MRQNGISGHLCSWFIGYSGKSIYKWERTIEANGQLRDKKRTGRPPIITEDTVMKTIAFYCQTKPLPVCNVLSFRWAERYLRENPEIVGYPISRSSIHHILSTHSLRPHRNKYFLQITDPEFFPKMQHIINLYLNPPEYLFCFDESTGLQAIERAAPKLPFAENKPNCEEFEYERHGTTAVMAALRVKTGKVFTRCVSDHKTPTLVSFFRQHIKEQPEDAVLHYICDNYSTHYHDDLCKLIAELCDIEYKPLKTGKQRRGWLQSQEKRIMIHFLPTHGSWLNMVEIWFGILQMKALKHNSFKSVPHLEDTIYSFSDTWDEYFAHPFTWKYKGEDLYEKALHRFIKWLVIESEEMTEKVLKKQFLLMINIMDNSWNKVKEKDWHQLLSLLQEKNTYLIRIIGNDTKTMDALQMLLSSLSENIKNSYKLSKRAA